MYTDSRQLIQFRSELISGGFDPTEAYGLVSAYYDARLDSRRDDGIVFLATEQDQDELSDQIDTPLDG